MYEKHKHFSAELEMAIIGACLIEKEAFGRVYNIVEPDCFYYSGNKLIFQTIKDMYVNGIPIDIYTVNDRLQRVKNIAQIGKWDTLYVLTKSTNDVVNTAHLEYHSFLIKSMWMEREILSLTTSGLKMEGDTKNKIQDIQNKLHDLNQKTTSHDWADMTELMVTLYQHQEEMKLTGGIGLATGISDIDKSNGGFHPGQMIVIGARPSVGKSAFAGSIALNVARNNKSVGIVSLEMSNTEIAARLAALDTNTDFNVLYRGLYRDEYQSQELYKRIGDHTSKLPIYVTDKTNVNVIDIRSKADKLKSLHNLDLLIIDYLQLIDVPDMANRNRENEIARISRYCKIMAKEMNIPVVLLCQLNRESTRRHGDDRYPKLSDLRESGSIEQDADAVIFLHRDWMIGQSANENGSSTEFEADLIIRKWRNGKSNFTIPLEFDPPKMKFKQRINQQWQPVDVDYQ
jgi:replicative DNA helicase